MAASQLQTPPPTPPRLTREALYDQVWATPLSTLAARWGISRNGLAKICDRVMVPYPGRGYWNAQKAARPPLPPAPAGAEAGIDLSKRARRARRGRARLAPGAGEGPRMAAGGG
ncbi:MAG TPA: hypothetical protein PKA17_08995, partial [Phenylobacterium sp.]|nr:hypothetical protein [Phenylobacterium sp.]